MRQGELDALPIADEELDACVAGMVLHHLAELSGPLSEMLRTLVPGGTAVVLELLPHREQWMRSSLGDRHLGLDSSDVLEAFERAGFEDVRLEHVDDRYCPTPPAEATTASASTGLELYLVRGRKPLR
jgi:ArsR family transcriptional regulator